MSNKTFTIKLEFTDVSSESPLDATKTILSWIKDGVEDMTYDVKDEATGEAFTVDLAEEDEDAVPAAASFGDVYFRLHERPFANVSA